MSLRRVLIVEDDAPLRAAIGRELAGKFETRAVASFDEAIAALDELGDLFAVVTDHNLGAGRTGRDLLTVVALRLPRCVRVLVSGTPGANAHAEGGHFIRKPWDRDEILTTLQGASP